MKKYIIQFLVGVLFLLLSSEVYLRYVDSDGLYHYLSAWEHLQIEPAPHGYVFKQGDYDLKRWQATIGADGFRHLNTKQSDCSIALIGDSMTFGWGVNNDQTWAQLLANEANATILMRSQPSYNIGNIKAVYDNVQADGYIYLVFQNDGEPDTKYQAYQGLFGVAKSALQYRIEYLQYVERKRQTISDVPRFLDLLGQMQSDKMLVMGVDSNHPFIQAIHTSIPYWITPSRHVVSRTDGHANAEGNAEMYEQIRTYALPFIEAVCIDHRT